MLTNEVKNENIVVVSTDKIITPESLSGEYAIDFAGMKEKYGLSYKQVLGAFLMATSRMSKVKLASELGVSRQTIYNWMMNQKFLQAYNSLCGAVLMGMKGTALQVMEELLEDEDSRVQFQAAKFVHENTDIIADVETVEEDAIDDLIGFFVNSPDEKKSVTIDTTEEDYDYANDIVDPSDVME